MPDGPLIIQSDRTVLLEVAHPQADDARHELAIFAELERAPEHVHTYRITRLGLWNARAAGHTAQQMLATLERYAKFPVPQTVQIDIDETVGRYGRLVIARDDADDGQLVIRGSDAAVLAEITRNSKIAPFPSARGSPSARSCPSIRSRSSFIVAAKAGSGARLRRFSASSDIRYSSSVARLPKDSSKK